MVRAVAATLGLELPSRLMEERTLGPSPSGDASLALAASRGDRQAFGRLVDHHKRSVYGLCHRLLRHPEDARDAAQESFVRAFAALETYDPTLPFAPWILRIARNHCLDLIRRRSGQPPEVELDGVPGDGSPELPDRATPLPDETLAARQQAGRLERAVAALPARYREVVHLFHAEHLSYKDIARTLDVPIGTVMTWLHRARAQLRQELVQPEDQP
jgi:RNA polymerase sigma-70 factor (ECF subfamily)